MQQLDYKKAFNKIALIYFLLNKDNKIVYIDGSKDLSNNRLLQNDRMRTNGSFSNKFNANNIVFLYDIEIKSAAKFYTKNYKNLESHLIYNIKAIYNTNSKKNYTPAWQQRNGNLCTLSCFDTTFLDSFHNNGVLNSNCALCPEIVPIKDLMMKDKKDSIISFSKLHTKQKKKHKNRSKRSLREYAEIVIRNSLRKGVI